MKKIYLLILVCSSAAFSCGLKQKDSFWLKSNEYFDVNGNMYQYKQGYSYRPSKKDSIDFSLESSRKIGQLMDSISKLQ